MVRQYRIDRYNGLEVLVCECYRKHTWTQMENDAFQSWKVEREKNLPAMIHVQTDFVNELNEWLDEEHEKNETFHGLVDPIPVYDSFPAIVLRSVVVDNRPASLQVDYLQSVLSPEILEEVKRFFGIFDSRHWRNMVAHQIENYGTLFKSFDD